MLKIIVGPTTNTAKVFLDGVDVTAALRIRSMTIGPLSANEVTTATLEVFAEAEVELLPEGVTVVVVDPESPAYGPHPEDVITWADGTTATRGEVERGDYAYMSDDYEVTPVDVANGEGLRTEAEQQADDEARLSGPFGGTERM